MLRESWTRRITNMLCWALARVLLWLRYRTKVHGLAQVRAHGTSGILFLPNHPALVDPIILMTILYPAFAPVFLGYHELLDIPFLGWIVRQFGVRTIPEITRYDPHARTEVSETMARSSGDLRHGENLVLYPAGGLKYSHLEDVGANSAVEAILQAFPEVRIVLVRTLGLWGSSFSQAQGAPDIPRVLWHGALSVLLNGIVFTPRRHVTVEFVEPTDFPRTTDRLTINRALESFYNALPDRNTYVPYTLWERGGTRTLPEPPVTVRTGDTSRVSSATRDIVINYLHSLSGKDVIHDEDQLARDLGLDSLDRAEVMAWLETEVGVPQQTVDALVTVADVLRAASGEVVAPIPALTPQSPPRRWLTQNVVQGRQTLPPGRTVTEVFLRQARHTPRKLILADQSSGAKTYREIIIAILALLPTLRALPGECIGIMLPASVTASIVYLTVLFAGKTPVMVNWTVGWRNIMHLLDLAEVTTVLTARAFLSRMAELGMELGPVATRCVLLEPLGTRISATRKLAAWLAGYLTWSSLASAPISPTAVILFTSGSESRPKAVPLTHTNLLTNLHDVLDVVPLYQQDTLLGLLPPFHSFGVTANLLAAVCLGVPMVCQPDPTAGAVIADTIARYQLSLVFGTPTFVYGILRAATAEQLTTIRLISTGAEECPPRLYEIAARLCPQALIIEGYGVTECSPIVAVNSPDDPHPYTIGRVLPSLESAIVDVETGAPVAHGVTGLLLLRGPSVFNGYLGTEMKSPFVAYAGQIWYRTGDLVSQDPAGILTFRGRLKRFVKIGGEMIALPAIEAYLQETSGVAAEEGPSLAVVATPDREPPELVLFTTHPMTRDEANQRLTAAGFSPLHHLHRVIMVSSLPLLGTGKTDYRRLQEQLQGESS